MNIPNIDLPRVVVIGAGFAGLQIARRTDVNHYQLVLLDKNNFHTFQPLLYQVATAGLEPDSIAYPIRKVLRGRKNTFYRMTEVTRIDHQNSKVVTGIGDIEYDILVIATGADNNYFGNNTIEGNALPMKSLVDALDLRSKILGNFEKALNTKDLGKREELMNFVIVGAGPTGVELAGALAELKNKILPKDFPDLDLRSMKINLIEAAPRVLTNLSPKSSQKAFKYLKALGVYIWTETFVENYEGNVVTTNSKIEFHADTLIWAAGVKGNIPNGISAKTLGKGNRIVTNEFCQVRDTENVFAVGDAGLVQSDLDPNGHPMLASVAMQQGQYIAKSLNQLAKGKTVKPFSYWDKGTMATVGRNQAVVELQKLKFQGFLAWVIWMFVHLMLLVGFRNRVIVFVNWAWNYVNYNNGLRLIVRPFIKKKKVSADNEKLVIV